MSRVQRTKQSRLKANRRSTALVLVTLALVIVAAAALDTLNLAQAAVPAARMAPVQSAAPAAKAASLLPASPTPIVAAQTATPALPTAVEQAIATPAPVPAVTEQEPVMPRVTPKPSISKTRTAAPEPAAPTPTQEGALALRNREPQPQAQAAQRERNAQVKPKAQPQTVYSLMPADFLHDDLTGSEAPALQRLLKRWGFSDDKAHSGWQPADSYHLSLYQRWAGLKPTGSVDAATRKSLLATWQKYADSAIPRQRLPLEGRYIGLNPGHQNRNFDRAITPDNDERFWDVTVGTRGRVTGLYEYELNLTVALKVRDALQAQGARVLLSRTSNDVRVSNSSRTSKLNKEQVDAVLLIHADGNSNPNLHGLHMIVSTRVSRQRGDVYERSHDLARALQGACITATGAADKGVGERDDLRILLSGCAMPAALIEMGYMTNPAEDRLLATDAYQNKIVSGLVQGFLTYFGK